jgi:hypothetical protein
MLYDICYLTLFYFILVQKFWPILLGPVSYFLKFQYPSIIYQLIYYLSLMFMLVEGKRLLATFHPKPYPCLYWLFFVVS